MPELIRPSTMLAANRKSFEFKTEDGIRLIGEVASPIGEKSASILTFHPNPTGGGMMDSHIYKKAANRLPALAGIEIIRFNTRGTKSEQGQSEGEYGFGESEKFDVEAALKFSFDQLHCENLWVMGWSFGTEIALKWVRDKRVKGLILLSPPMKTVKDSDLDYWIADGRPITALVPEFDEYLVPDEAKHRFSLVPHAQVIGIDGAKHLWVGEKNVVAVLNETVACVDPTKSPLPTFVDGPMERWSDL